MSQVVQEPQTLSEHLILVGSCCSIFSVLCSFCRSLFVFFVWSLHCLSFDLRLLVTPLVSSIFLISDTWALDQHPSAFYLIKSPITLDYKVFITCILLSYCSVVSLVTFDTIDKEGTSKIIWYILIFKRKWLNENPRVTEVFAVVYMF